MALREKRRKGVVEKILDVDASMQGTLRFRDPVNLRINGEFEGSLDTKGDLTIGEGAVVSANIVGENIVVSGKVIGNITASSKLTLTSSASVAGDIFTPLLSVDEGARFRGKCQMEVELESSSPEREDLLTAEEVAGYLEIDTDSLLEWASSGKIPALRDGDNWKFERAKIDKWIAEEKIS